MNVFYANKINKTFCCLLILVVGLIDAFYDRLHVFVSSLIIQFFLQNLLQDFILGPLQLLTVSLENPEDLLLFPQLFLQRCCDVFVVHIQRIVQNFIDSLKDLLFGDRELATSRLCLDNL